MTLFQFWKKQLSVSPGLAQVYNRHFHHKKNGTELCHYPRYPLKSDLKHVGPYCIGRQFLKSYISARITKRSHSAQKSFSVFLFLVFFLFAQLIRPEKQRSFWVQHFA